MDGYEANMEMFLVARTHWLWRKAVFITRLVVKLNRMAKACHGIRACRETHKALPFEVSMGEISIPQRPRTMKSRTSRLKNAVSVV